MKSLEKTVFVIGLYGGAGLTAGVLACVGVFLALSQAIKFVVGLVGL